MKLHTQTLFVLLISSSPLWAGPSGTAYSIGSPTAKEQLYVELINRARANPTQEGITLAGYNATFTDIASAYSYFSVNLTTMQAEFVTGSSSGKPTLNVTQPLSINSMLTTAARLHSQDQITWDYQGHVGHNGSTFDQRITAQGYTWSTAGENVFASSNNVTYGHAGFEVDWGGSDGTGMQGPPRGHRANIHTSAFREIGVGNLTSTETSIPGTNTNAKGPEVVSQELATASGATPFITGVVYYDFNGNSFYDPGEGISGVEVGATGSSYKGVTASSGGYSIPVPSNGTYPLTFWFPGASSATFSTSATVASSLNVKVDWKPTYTAPTVSGSLNPVINTSNSYSCTAVGGAASYDFKTAQITSTPATENADSGSSGYTLTPGAGGTLAVETGGVTGNCFHFGHNGISSPSLALTRTFTPGSSGSVSFKSKLAYATDVEIAKLQLRVNGGSWTTAWSQAGSNGSGESSYNTRTLSLAAYSGSNVELRFVYEFASGGYYPSGTSVGWYLDNISFTGVEELTSVTTTNQVTNSFSFTPTVAGNYRIWVSPRLSDPLYQLAPSSSQLAVTAVAGGYSNWIATYYPSVTGGPTADHEKDGISNLLEYAFGLNPTVANPSTALPQPVRSGSNLVLSYTIPSGVTGLTYGAEWSTNLSTWNALTNTGSGSTRTFSVSTTGKTSLYMRHRITLP